MQPATTLMKWESFHWSIIYTVIPAPAFHVLDVDIEELRAQADASMSASNNNVNVHYTN